MIQTGHLIAGEWISTDTHFSSAPASGASQQFSECDQTLLDRACEIAAVAAVSYGSISRADRATFLDTIADNLEAMREQICAQGVQETGLPPARLQGELGRTVGQLKLFAGHIRDARYLDIRIDEALPDRAPLPRPELRSVQRPLGPVAVFGASNFPLAFSTAGGDTASALAAGCPVVVKGHAAHPGTSALAAQAIGAAVESCALHPGVFSFVQSSGIDIGTRLVQHAAIKAVGFTGSIAGGRALFDLCAQRAQPIPFYGELGSVNPMLVLPGALRARGESIAQGWAASLTMGAGQFCTNPGVVFLIDSPAADAFIQASAASLKDVAAQTMLSDGIAANYGRGCGKLAAATGVKTLLAAEVDGRSATPALYQCEGLDFAASPEVAEEIFGPAGLVVKVQNETVLLELLAQMDGQLTCTLQLDSADTALGRQLMPVLEGLAGRILANGFPTGVEVCESMVHGGPYPASTNASSTSVGTMAIRRFLKAVCYQNLPAELLPAEFD